MNDHLKIFVSAYACEPASGSEIGVGWHWVLEMSKRFELWVLTRESNRHNIEPWISEHPEYGNIHWLYFDLLSVTVGLLAARLLERAVR